MSDSIFTKIIKGEIPCHKIAENEDFIAFLDIMPLKKGHTLVVPKVQIDYIFDLEDQTYTFLCLDTIYRLCKHILSYYLVFTLYRMNSNFSATREVSDLFLKGKSFNILFSIVLTFLSTLMTQSYVVPFFLILRTLIFKILGILECAAAELSY